MQKEDEGSGKAVSIDTCSISVFTADNGEMEPDLDEAEVVSERSIKSVTHPRYLNMMFVELNSSTSGTFEPRSNNTCTDMSTFTRQFVELPGEDKIIAQLKMAEEGIITSEMWTQPPNLLHGGPQKQTLGNERHYANSANSSSTCRLG